MMHDPLSPHTSFDGSGFDGSTDDALDAYLDGLLNGDALAAFERRIDSDPALRTQIELSRRLDAELRGQFKYDPRPSAIGSPRLTIPRADSRDAARRRLHIYAAAAAILLALAGTWSIYVRTNAPPRTLFEAVEVAHARLVAAGFTPEFVCTDDPAFRKAVADQFGQALSIPAPIPSDIHLVGWAYGNDYAQRLLGPKTLVLMAQVKGKPVIVLIDDAQFDRTVEVAENSGLTLYKRRIGKLIAVEVTPFSEAEIVPRLVDPGL